MHFKSEQFGLKSRRFLAGLLVFALLFTGCSLPQKANEKDPVAGATMENIQAGFDKFLDDLFVEELDENIINLHYTVANPENYGIRDYQCSLGDFSEESYKESKEEAKKTLEELQKYDYDKLNEDQKKSYDLIKEVLELNASASDDFYLYDEPLSPTNGVQSQLPVLLAEYRFRTKQDVEDYLETLETLEDYFENLMEFEKKRAEAGLFMSDANLDTVIKQCESFCENIEEHLLLVTFTERLEELDATESEKGLWERSNEELVKNTVIPIYRNLAEELEKMRGSAKTNGGLATLEKGKKYYEYLVRCATGSDRSVKDMQSLISQYEQQDLDEVVQIVTEDPSLYGLMDEPEISKTEPGEILSDLQEKIKADFPVTACENYQVKKVDKSLEELSSPAFYLTPAIDDIESNVIYINGANAYEGLKLYTTLAHEGYPGHLYQETYYKDKKPHPVRSILSYGGYSEGWGLYSEIYSYDFAGMEEKLARLCRCNFTVTMGMYANMDIGIHYEGWSLTETAEYLKGYGITDGEAVEEVYNYIVAEPGNYLKYYMGYLEIQELKKYTREQLGENYSDLTFHTFFLNQGPSSFTMLRKWFEEEFGK